MPSPIEVVQAQFDAYNRHDLDAFVAVHSPTVELYRFPTNDLILSGRDALREFYGTNRFSIPELRAELIQRQTLGPYVIDTERLFGLGADDVLDVIAIYRVEDGLIAKVWFIREW